MKLLISHIEFEQLIGLQEPEPGVVLPHFTVIYFTAKWCGPCRAFDWESIKDSLKGYTVYICDVDDNTYTPGFCGVRSIPNFLTISKTNVIRTKAI